MKHSFYLRELSRDDINKINEWRNNRELIDNLGAPFRYIDSSVDTAWIESYFSNRSQCVRLAICDESTNNLIGAIYLLNIDWLSKNCELAVWIGDDNYRGKGAGYFSVYNALKHAFLDLNLHKVYLTVLENNTPAIKLYEKSGFVFEGIHREAVYKNGNYLNMQQLSILSTEFKLEQ